MSTPEQAIRYVDGGTVQAGEGVYVERAADKILLELCREGKFAYVLTSRQMGKSSLMIRTAERLIDEGIKPVIVDLTELGANTTAEQWYRGFLEKVADPLELPTQVGPWWEANRHLSVAQRFNQFMIDVVLNEIHEPIVVFVDEIDTTLRLDFTDDFFASIRYLYNARSSQKQLGQLSFVLLGVATPSDLMKDPERTPFNIGRRVDLQDFKEEEATRDLRASSDQVRSVFRYTSGHPYLTLRVFRSLSDRPLGSEDLDSRIESLFFGEQAVIDTNLQFVRDMLTERARDRDAVLRRYREVWKGKKVADQAADPVCVWLRLSGVVRSESGLLQVRNLIYQRVFDADWIRRNRKVNWARLLVLGAGIIVALLILVAAILAPKYYLEKNKAEKAWVQERKQKEIAAKNADTARQNAELAELNASEAHRQQIAAETAKDEESKQRNLAVANAESARVNAKRAEANATAAAANAVAATKLEKLAEDNASEAMAQKKAAETAAEQARIFEREAKAGAATSAARESLGDDPERSILLGMYAMNATLTYGQPVLPYAVEALHQAILSSKVRLTLRGHEGRVRKVAFDSEGRIVATAGDDGTVRVWSASTGKELLTLRGHEQRVWAVAFSPGGKLLATGSADKTVKIWNRENGNVLHILRGHTDEVRAVAFSPDGKSLATASDADGIIVWDWESGKELQTLRDGEEQLFAVAFSPDGKRLAIVGYDSKRTHYPIMNSGTVKIWSLKNGDKVMDLRGHSQPVVDVAFSLDGKRLATAGWDKSARVWDVATGKELLNLRGFSDCVSSVAFSPDGTRIAAASWDGTAKLWDSDRGTEIATLRGHTDAINSIAYSPDGKRLATASWDGTARLWDLQPSELLALSGYTGQVLGLAFSYDARSITAVYGAGASSWDAESGKKLLTSPMPHEEFWDSESALSLDSTRVATSRKDGTISVWDAHDGKELLSLRGHNATVTSVAFSPDSQRLATGSKDETISLWDLQDGKELLSLRGHKAGATSVAFSPDGKRLATVSDDLTVKIWDAQTGLELRTLSGQLGRTIAVSFSPDGRRLASAGADRTVSIWDVESGNELLVLRGHSNSVNAAVFSRDGTRLATADTGGSAKVWDASNGKELLTVKGHTGRVNAVAFSPDSRRLATGGEDGIIQVYTLDIHELLDLAGHRVTRALTLDECQRYLHVENCPSLP